MKHDYKFNFNITLSTNEIFGYSFSIIKNNLLFLLKLFLLLIIPSLILFIFSSVRLIDFIKLIASMPEEELSNTKELATQSLSIITMLLVLFIINTLIKTILIKFTENIVRGDSSVIEKNIVDSIKLFLPLLITMLIGSIMIWLGYFLLVLPGVIISVLLIYIPHIVIIDNKNYFYAIGKSILYGLRTFWAVILFPFFIYSSCFVINLFITSFFSSDIFLNIVNKIFNLTMTGKMLLSNKIFLVFQFSIFYFIFLIFYILSQITVTLKYINIRTIDLGPMKGKENNLTENDENSIDNKEENEL